MSAEQPLRSALRVSAPHTMTTCLPSSLNRILRIAYLLIGVFQVLAMDPVVSNVQAKQREGSRLVDITYDVTDPDSPTLTVYLKVSPDGGKTWKGPVELVSGDVGQHIAPGNAKRLVWDAGKEMANQYGANFRYKVGANDWQVPSGMVLILAGRFQMGDDRLDTSVRQVTLSSYAIDKWEVSIELWEEVRRWGNSHGYDIIQGESYGPRHPVNSVSWSEAVKWNNARSEKSGLVPAYYLDTGLTQVFRRGEAVSPQVRWRSGYRLPTEAEWEKAARGGLNGKLYPWGDEAIALGNLTCGTNKTTPIGTYPPNGYGLYDVAGNLFEWCWDWYDNYPLVPQNDPHGPNSPIQDQYKTGRVFRGGSWITPVTNCRLAIRYRVTDPPGWRDNTAYGFRCVLPPEI